MFVDFLRKPLPFLVPDEVLVMHFHIQPYDLQEGCLKPSLSLYW